MLSTSVVHYTIIRHYNSMVLCLLVLEIYISILFYSILFYSSTVANRCSCPKTDHNSPEQSSSWHHAYLDLPQLLYVFPSATFTGIESQHVQSMMRVMLAVQLFNTRFPVTGANCSWNPCLCTKGPIPLHKQVQRTLPEIINFNGCWYA